MADEQKPSRPENGATTNRSQQTLTPEQRARRKARAEAAKKQRKQKLADQQKIVFAAIFLISLIIISPFLVRGMVANNKEKKAAEEQQAAYRVSYSQASADAKVLPSSISKEQEHFFRNTLFLGDSRTVGLRDYAGMEEADFFCDIGMDAEKIMKESLKTERYGKTTLAALLSGRSYSRIYVMLGINQVGNNRQKVLSDFSSLVEYLRKTAPGSQIIVMGNLHVTAEKSDPSTGITNANIDSLNQQMQSVAVANGCRYLDANPAFDDKNGALNQSYSGDGTHLYGKYYELWRNWIAAQG